MKRFGKIVLVCLGGLVAAGCSSSDDSNDGNQTSSIVEPERAVPFALEGATARYVNSQANVEQVGLASDFFDFSFEYPETWAVVSPGPLPSNAFVAQDAMANSRTIFVGALDMADLASEDPSPVTLLSTLSEIIRTEMIVSGGRYHRVEILESDGKIEDGTVIYRLHYNGFGPPTYAEADVPILGTVIAAMPVESPYAIVISYEADPVTTGMETIDALLNDDAFHLLASTLVVDGVSLNSALQSEPSE